LLIAETHWPTLRSADDPTGIGAGTAPHRLGQESDKDNLAEDVQMMNRECRNFIFPVLISAIALMNCARTLSAPSLGWC
jgi:hypothetical protein